MVAKNRQAKGARTRPETRVKGEAHPKAKLKAEQVLQIRESHDPTSVLAERFGLSCEHVLHIKKRKTWSHLP
jgi:hypothetical protein